MSSETSLTIRNADLQVWQTIQAIAPVAQASRMFGVTEEQAAIVMLKGYELGLGLAAAFEFIHVIQGKPGVSPKGALALIHQSNQLAGLKIEDIERDGKPYACKAWMKRTNGFEYSSQFTMDDAERAQLVKKDSGWDKYPANMLRWRAIGYVADVVFPDVIGGMYRPEELGATVDAEGEPIEAQFTVMEPPVASETGSAGQQQLSPPNSIPTTVPQLMALGYEAQAIMDISPTVLGADKPIPQTAEDVKLVYEALEAAKSS